MLRRTLSIGAIIVLLLSLNGCGSISYYSQAARGHLDLMSRRQNVVDLLASEEVPAELKAKLRLTQEARDFASEELALPDNQSYRSYADLERSHVLWNVFATEEFSVNAKTWCYWFVGCLGYRGYFAEQRAYKEAEILKKQRHDVYVGGVSAYSTLGRFADPVLNTMFTRPDIYVVELIFHELTHQQTYRIGDSEFSESLASFVQEEGVQRWLLAHNDESGLMAYRQAQERNNQFAELLITTRDKLQELYQQDLMEASRRQQKAQIFEQLQSDYQVLRQSWGGYAGYDRWFSQELNNAHLLSISTYHRLIPAFRQLLAQENGDMPAFFIQTQRMANLDDKRLREEIEQLLSANEKAIGAKVN